MTAVGEFELIRNYFSAVGRDSSESVRLGVGDDCAIISPPPEQELVISIDTLVEGTHFLPGTAPAQIATRALGAALSDLAAMGAQPAFFTLALTLPEADSRWLAGFSAALADMAKRYGVQLVGGDTTRGPLTVSIQVHGWCRKGKALRRDGAKPGDRIFVTGTLGDSRGGLESLQQPQSAGYNHHYLHQRFFEPEPRLDTAQIIGEFATAAIDISDGLLADLNHILQGSGVGAMINLEELPISEVLHRWAGEKISREWALRGGEDFELCFTVPALLEPKLNWALRQHEVSVTCIGQISQESGIVLVDDGQITGAEPLGYNHFSGR